MRCPSCGTENAPDSRFCGGCGARLASESKVAPTAKISDDARYPQFTSNPPPVDMPRTPSRPPQMPEAPRITPVPSSAPMPRTVSKPPSMPPPVMSAPEPVRPPKPMAHASSAAITTAPPRRRKWGLVFAILIVDAGLAIAGGAMLAAGMQSDDAPAPAVVPVAPPPAPVKTTEVVPPKVEIGKTTIAKPAARKPPPPKPKPKPAANQPSEWGTGGPPADEGDFITDDHNAAISEAIDIKSNHAASVFSRCYSQATKPLPPEQPLKGRIMIAFAVTPAGKVDRVRTAENQTGSDQLAGCLATEIASWTFTDHPSESIEITKIFAFGPSS